MRRRNRRHHDAAARRRFKIAFGVEQIAGGQHHRARTAQFARDLARANELRSGRKDAAQNAVADVSRNLQMQRHGRIPVDMHPGKGHALAWLTISVHRVEVSCWNGRQKSPVSAQDGPRADSGPVPAGHEFIHPVSLAI
jgi:hypothetical protein